MSKNYNLTDDNAELLAGNAWVYNNRDGDTKRTPDLTVNITVDENFSPLPSSTGNSSTNLLKVTRGTGTTSFYSLIMKISILLLQEL